VKKLLLISLICILVFSLTVLISAKEKIKINYWTAPFFQAIDKEAGWFENEAAREFEEIYPEVEIEILVIPWAQGDEKIRIAIASDTMPDIMMHSNDRLWDLANRGLAVSFNDVIPLEVRERYVPYVKDTCIYDGELMVLAWTLNPQNGMCVNLDLAKKAGAYELLPLDDPLRRWSHEECLVFWRQCATLKDEGIYPYAIPAASRTGDMSTRQLMAQFGMEVFNEDGTKLIMNSPEGVKALEWIVALNDEGLLYPNPETLLGEDTVEIFFGGELVSWYGSGRMYATNEKYTSRVPNIWYLQYPTIAGVDPKLTGGIGGLVVLDNGDTERAKYAKLFCKWLLENRDADQAGAFSPFLDSDTEYENNNLQFVSKCGHLVGDYFGETELYYPMLRENMYIELQAAFLHIKTPQEALDDLCATMNTLMEE